MKRKRILVLYECASRTRISSGVTLLLLVLALVALGCTDHCMLATKAYDEAQYPKARAELGDSKDYCATLAAENIYGAERLELKFKNAIEKIRSNPILAMESFIDLINSYTSVRPNSKLRGLVEDSRTEINAIGCKIIEGRRIAKQYVELKAFYDSNRQYITSQSCISSVMEAERRLTNASNLLTQADQAFDSGKSNADLNSFRAAIRLCNQVRTEVPDFAERAKELINKCELELQGANRGAVETLIREGMSLFNEPYRGSLVAERKKYQDAQQKFSQALNAAKKNPEILVDAGPIRRRLDIAAQSKSKFDKAIRDSVHYIATGGYPLSPPVIDLSTSKDKISAIGEGTSGNGQKSKQQGEAKIAGYKHLECGIQQDFVVEVFRSSFNQDPSNNVVSSTYLQKGKKYWRCDGFEKGNFYLLISKPGLASKYSIDCTVYSDIER